MTTKETSKPAAPVNGYEKTKQLMEETGSNGLLKPLMKKLDTLLDDPVLKKTMEEMPAQQPVPAKDKKN